MSGYVLIRDEDGKTLLTIYRQYDCYPGGLGKDLAEFMDGRVVGNGIPGDLPKDAKFSNGMGELAAQLVVALKAPCDRGNVYLYPPDSTDCGEEYVYVIEGKFGKCEPTLTAFSVGSDKPLCVATPANAKAAMSAAKEADEE